LEAELVCATVKELQETGNLPNYSPKEAVEFKQA
jgi:hypothetical protein